MQRGWGSAYGWCASVPVWCGRVCGVVALHAAVGAQMKMNFLMSSDLRTSFTLSDGHALQGGSTGKAGWGAWEGVQTRPVLMRKYGQRMGAAYCSPFPLPILEASGLGLGRQRGILGQAMHAQGGCGPGCLVLSAWIR